MLDYAKFTKNNVLQIKITKKTNIKNIIPPVFQSVFRMETFFTLAEQIDIIKYENKTSLL